MTKAHLSTFCHKFSDGVTQWVHWSKDLFDSVPYENFCQKHKELMPLLYTVEVAEKLISEINRTPITEFRVGDKVYVDLRSYGEDWFQSLDLSDKFIKKYVVLYMYKGFKRNNKRATMHCPVFRETFEVDHEYVRAYGSIRVFDPRAMVLIDKAFVKKHPAVLPAEEEESREEG